MSHSTVKGHRIGSHLVTDLNKNEKYEQVWEMFTSVECVPLSAFMVSNMYLLIKCNWQQTGTWSWMLHIGQASKASTAHDARSKAVNERSIFTYCYSGCEHALLLMWGKTVGRCSTKACQLKASAWTKQFSSRRLTIGVPILEFTAPKVILVTGL